MIDHQELLAALTHLALGSEEFLGSGFVSNLTISGGIAQPVSTFYVAILLPALRRAKEAANGAQCSSNQLR